MVKIYNKYEMSYIRKMGNKDTNVTENELVILLPEGCMWAKDKKMKACSYCGYQTLVDEMRSTSEFDDYIEIIDHEMNKQTEKIDRVSFFVGGSFLEIDKTERNKIIEKMNEYPQVKEIFFETRPELVTSKNVKELRERIPDKQLTVAIGLESSNDYIRNVIHTKSITKKVFERAMKFLKDAGVDPLIYVFVKPPMENMTDEEAIKDALDTIMYSFDQGATFIELECGYIVENSEMHKLFLDGKYKTLSLWSIQKLLQEAINKNKGIIRLAYFSDTPTPVEIPHNCGDCDELFLNMFDKYRETLDSEVINQKIECSCAG